MALGEMPILALEPRVVPTVIAGPYYNPHDGVTATLTENTVNGVGISDTAHVTNTSNTTVTVAFASYDNATAGSTPTGGAHNEYDQQRTGVVVVQLNPGCSVNLTLCEDPDGYCGCDPTGTQFDVSCVPSSQLCGMTTCEQEDYLAPQTITPTDTARLASEALGGEVTYNYL